MGNWFDFLFKKLRKYSHGSRFGTQGRGTGGNGDLPGHITSQHVEGAPTLCAKRRPMAILEKTIPSYEGNVFELCTFISVLHE